MVSLREALADRRRSVHQVCIRLLPDADVLESQLEMITYLAGFRIKGIPLDGELFDNLWTLSVLDWADIGRSNPAIRSGVDSCFRKYFKTPNEVVDVIIGIANTGTHKSCWLDFGSVGQGATGTETFFIRATTTFEQGNGMFCCVG